MKKKPTPKHPWMRVTASILGLAILAANLAVPAHASSIDNPSDSAQTVQTVAYFVEVEKENGQSVSNSIEVKLAKDDLHHFTLTASDTTLTGYAAVKMTGADNTAKTVCIPIPGNSTVNLTVQAAKGTKISFSSGWGAPPSSDHVIEPTSGPDGTDSSLMAYIEFSRTPSIAYTVPERSYLEVIAGYYGVPPEDILLYNGIDSIAPGDEILIPNPVTEIPYEPPAVYTVVEGDCLGIIAEAFDVTVKSLCQWNGLSVDGVICPGMELTIPVLYQAPEPVQTQPVETEPAETQPVETEPAESLPVETEPVETEPAETEPVAAEPVESQPEDDTVYVCGVPLYFQEDYPEALYGDGTVENNGCSVTSLTMVANAVTGYDYEVDELAEYFGGRALNHIDRLEKGSKALGLSFRKTKNWNETWKALNDGKIAIALMDGIGRGCLFTESQHFIVLTGLNEQGKIMVNDSNKGNYDKWDLKNGFENGFDPADILYGYSGAWVYDRQLEEPPERYREERIIRSEENKNYPEITLTSAERALLARVIWAEARGECKEGQQAIAEVVFNRMMSDQFGDTLESVIYGQGQFRSVPYLEKAEPGQAQYYAIDRAMYGKLVLNKNVFYFATTPTNRKIYKQIGNHIFCY